MKQNKTLDKITTQHVQMLQQPIREHTSQSDTTTLTNGTTHGTDAQIQHPESVISRKWYDNKQPQSKDYT